MSRLSHLAALLSIAPLTLAAASAAAAPAPASSLYYGRWAVSEERPVFTARGREYKTIDVAPCGQDFCGVSVADNGRCGAVLFRFLGHRARDTSEDYLRGHGKWGAAKKNVVIYAYDETDATPVRRSLELYLGEGYDFGERSDNMPKFHANYSRTGKALCKSR